MNVDRSERMDRNALIGVLKEAGCVFTHQSNACRCAFHDDRRASAGIYQDDNGVWRYKCQVPTCGVSGDVFDIRARVSSRQLRDVLPRADEGAAPRVIQAYPYVDGQGALLYEVVRMYPKGFRQRQPDGSGGWLWNMQGVKRVLFRLPEVTEAVPAGTTIYIVEGEKDVITLEQHGLVATTNCGGAGKWRAEYSEVLRGAEVVILPDADEPGRTHGQTIAESLHGIARSVKVVELSGLPVKGDVSDWFSQGHTREELETNVSGAPMWTPKRIDTLDTPTRQPSTSQERTGEQPKPLPLPKVRLFPVKPFEPELLPAVFRRWVMDGSERMQSPPDFLAVGAMVAIASVIGRQVAIRPKRQDDWTVVPNLWGAIIGRPSVMKSPTLLETVKPLQRLEVRAKSEYEAAVLRFEALALVTEERVKDAKKRAAKAINRNNDPDVTSIMNLLSDREDEPLRKRYIVNDTTVEKLGEILAANPNGILAFRDELVGLLKSLDKDGHEAARAFYLESWAGTGRFTYDRIGRGTIDIEAACVSILGGIQPGPLGEYLRAATKGGAGDDGLLPRFQLLVWPDVSSEWHNVDRWPDANAKNEAYAVFERLADIQGDMLETVSENGDIPYLRFTPDAQDLFDGWRVELENRLRNGDEHPAIESHLAKYRSLIPSLALIIHLVDGEIGPVSAGALARAMEWGVYLESHARRIYGAGLASDLDGARTILKHITKGEFASPFTAREVNRRCWTGLTTIDDVNQALDILLDHHILASRTVQTGGKPRVEFLVSERIKELE